MGSQGERETGLTQPTHDADEGAGTHLSAFGFQERRLPQVSRNRKENEVTPGPSTVSLKLPPSS